MDKMKTINFKGKEYITVSERVKYFNEKYPNGSIETELISLPEADRVVFKAIIVPDSSKLERLFIGHSQAIWGDSYINKTSALENAETSAVGRALGLMGIGIVDSIASADEINKTTHYKQDVVPHTKQPYTKRETDFGKDMNLNEQY